MIKLLKEGKYLLGETKQHTKLLYLDGECFIWVAVPSIGDILNKAQKDHKIYTTLSTGVYKRYHVKDEPEFVDLQHLELEVGEDTWQGFLLLTGLPTNKKRRSRIISTKELVSTSDISSAAKKDIKS